MRRNLRAVNGLTASTTQTQAGGLPLDPGTYIHRVTTVGTAADAVVLPKAINGNSYIVINAAASNSMGIFPALGDQINALSVNAVLATAANKTVLFACAVDGIWNAIVTA
jgi:hypothetical protein